jgi:MinD-like ATPase involved in chromosome partitioning or flagellar assembly
MLARGRWHRPPPPSQGTRVIAVGSTGGRVGKSTIAAQLAVAIANLGAQVIVVDLDARAPALPRILGVERPALGWHALLTKEIQTLDSSLTRTSVRNLQLVAAGTLRAGARRPGSSALDAEQRRLLLHHLRALEGDVVILDLAAESYDDLADFFSLAELGLLVTSPLRASLSASLGFLGHAVRRASQRVDRPDGRPAPLAGFRARLVGNQAAATEHVEIFHAFSRLVRAELSVDLPVIGCVRNQDRLAETEVPGHAPLRHGAFDANAQTFTRMGERLLHENLDDESPADLELDAEPDAAPSSDVASLIPAETSTETSTVASTEASLHDDARPVEPSRLLANHLDRHCRKHLRHEVDWAATLKVGAREIAVRVVDVSLSGAALEIVSQLELGAPATLRFDQLPGQPALPVIVKGLQADIRRAGVSFLGDEATRHELVAAAQVRRGPAQEPADVTDVIDDDDVPPVRVPGGAAR